MGKKRYTDGLTYELIDRASQGEEAALEEILRIYESYHNSLVTTYVLGKDGKVHKKFDEDKKIQIEMHLVEAIKTKWRKLI